MVGLRGGVEFDGAHTGEICSENEESRDTWSTDLIKEEEDASILKRIVVLLSVLPGMCWW